MNVYYRKNGHATQLPVSLESAKEKRAQVYWDDDSPCPICGEAKKLTRTGSCFGCTESDAGDFANIAAYDNTCTLTVAGWQVDNPYKSKEPRHITVDQAEAMREGLQILGIDGSDKTQIRAAKRAPQNNQGGRIYVRHKPCLRCGRFGIMTEEHSCWYCKNRPLARPTKTKAVKEPRTTPEMTLMAEQPNIVLSRDEARALGLKVFRTGKPCKHGHTGFRYVSTKGCIQCLKENG